MTKNFLPAELNVIKMYRMYTDWCNAKKKKKETYDTYYKVFKRNFSLFHKPKKDQCSTCESYELSEKGPTDLKSCRKSIWQTRNWQEILRKKLR